MNSMNESLPETDRIGDRHGSMVVVQVLTRETLSLVRSLVEGRIRHEPGRCPYRWAGHGSYTSIDEGLRFGIYCPACGRSRTLCQCGQEREDATPIKGTARHHGLQADAFRVLG